MVGGVGAGQPTVDEPDPAWRAGSDRVGGCAAKGTLLDRSTKRSRPLHSDTTRSTAARVGTSGARRGYPAEDHRPACQIDHDRVGARVLGDLICGADGNDVSPSMAMASTVPTAGSMVTTGPPVKIKSTASGAAAVVVGATVVVVPSKVEEVGSVESSCAVVVAAVVGVSAPP